LTREDEREMPEYVKNEIMKAYPVFKDRLSPNDFMSRMRVLCEEEVSNFWRASQTFQRFQKCKDCDQDLAMTLLCSTVETMRPRTKQIEFSTWLIKNRLDDLEMKNKKELETAICNARSDFLKIPEREGARHNFIQFLLENCPTELRTVPNVLADHYERKKIDAEFPFKEALELIYDRFRSLFIHEALPSFYKPETRNFVNYRMHRIVIYQKHLITLDLVEFLDWFSKVVKESLWNNFVSNTSLKN
jgi:hypothetical protein